MPWPNIADASKPLQFETSSSRLPDTTLHRPIPPNVHPNYLGTKDPKPGLDVVGMRNLWGLHKPIKQFVWMQQDSNRTSYDRMIECRGLHQTTGQALPVQPCAVFLTNDGRSAMPGKPTTTARLAWAWLKKLCGLQNGTAMPQCTAFLVRPKLCNPKPGCDLAASRASRMFPNILKPTGVLDVDSDVWALDISINIWDFTIARSGDDVTFQVCVDVVFVLFVLFPAPFNEGVGTWWRMSWPT